MCSVCMLIWSALQPSWISEQCVFNDKFILSFVMTQYTYFLIAYTSIYWAGSREIILTSYKW